MNVLDEPTEFEDQIDRAHIERRIDDWVRRLENLYREVRSWLSSGWSARSAGQVILRDDLMDRFDVPDQTLPALSLEWKGP